MQRTKSYRKNIVREITGSLGRFVSIFAIVALGTGFFAGLGATSPDMEYSVDKYYDDSAMFDLRVVSPLGLTQDDAAAIARTEGIASVMPAYCADVMMDVSEGVSLAARLHSLPDAQGLNRVTLLEGTLPSAPDECLVTRLKNVTAIPEIGSTITVAEETETEGVLTERTFTVTGIADSSCYFSIERDSTTLGSGTINMVLWLPEEAFALDAYAEIYALAEGAAALNAFDDAYETHVDDVQARLEALSAERIAARAEELTAEPRAELEKGRAELAENRAEAEKQLGDAEEALTAAREQLEDNEAALAEQADALRAQGYTEAMLDAALASARSQLEAGWTEYEENAATYEENRAETERKLTDAQKKLDDAQAQIDAVGEAEWYVQDRGSNLSYVSFDGNSQKIAAIAVVFPVFFFLVAALVALTTMTRMVEEQRVQIGTFKALGYNNAAIAMKYLLYAGTSTLLGSVLGLVVGMQLFPRILWNAYGIMYLLPEFYAPFRWDYGLLAFFSTLLCTLAAAWSACRHSLRESAASLMLPKAPKAGKRVLLEYITPIWKRMRFTHKVTVRNLFRYKKRFFMTVVGIAGCTALLVTGFGLSDSINEILDKQYEELNHYDMLVMCTDEEAAESEDIRTILSHGTLAVHQENCEVSLSGKEMEAYLFVPETPEHLPDFLTLRGRRSGERYTLSEDAVILTEKASEKLRCKAGDTLTLQPQDGREVQVEIGAVCENYVNTYVYMHPALYASLFEAEPECRMLLAELSHLDDAAQHDVAERLLACEDVRLLSLVSDMRTSFRSMVKSIDLIVYVLIVCAGLLAFVVLYNLMNINITERQRELATIKVLGFYEGEVGAYVFRETLILSFIGTLAGLVLGIFLHAFVVRTAEVDMAMFGREIAPSSFAYAGVLTMFFSLLVCMAMRPKLRRIDMVESLKSVE